LLFARNASFFWLLCGGIGLLAALLVWIGGGSRYEESEAGANNLKATRASIEMIGEPR